MSGQAGSVGPDVKGEAPTHGAPIKEPIGSVPQTRSATQGIEQSIPSLVHTITHHGTSVLSLAVDAKGRQLFSGSQGEDIYVWDLDTLQEKARMKGHTGSVLAMEIAPEKGWLFSSSGDNTVRVWDVRTLRPVYIIYPADDNVGDIFCLAWSAKRRTLYIGCQNTSIQWIIFADDVSSAASTSLSSPFPIPVHKPHRFFDSYRPSPIHGQSPSGSGTSTPASGLAHLFTTGRIAPGTESGHALDSVHPDEDETTPRLQIAVEDVMPSAHFGYVYSLNLTYLSERYPEVLVSGSGDEDVKLWECRPTGLTLITTLHGCLGGVLALATRQSTLFAGVQDGHVKIWDLETFTLIRTLTAHEDDVLSLVSVGEELFTASANGEMKRWNKSFQCTATWCAHDGIILSTIVHENVPNHPLLITGASDNKIQFWELDVRSRRQSDSSNGLLHPWQDSLMRSLRKFITFQTISDDSHREDCRQCALFLKRTFSQLGAEASLVSAREGENPLVLATFRGKDRPDGEKKPRIAVYGHYDVISAGEGYWDSDPWELFGRNGYLFGRGVSDNKGPILAVAHAASSLLSERALDVDVVMIIEGEEESGSSGFRDALHKYKEQIGHIDAVLVCNSYWLGETEPCLTIGLRGVVRATVEISSDHPDVHSGVEGGAVDEPMVDMVRVLGSLCDGNRVKVQGFYNAVRRVTKEETDYYQTIVKGHAGRVGSAESLMARWRYPALSIHTVNVSGPGNSTVIPRKVSATVSVRIVPDQDLDEIARMLVDHLQKSFTSLHSKNTIHVSIDHMAGWWLGSTEHQYWKALAGAVANEWGAKPWYIREGGSIPALAILEKALGAPVLALPFGQSSDQGHLPNERIRVENLHKGRSVVRRFLCSLPSSIQA